MIEASPVHKHKLDPNFETNVVSIDYRGSALLVIVEYSENRFYEIKFEQQISAFRSMEEGDLTYYWQSNVFNDSCLVYEIVKGGWLSKEGASIDILGIARSEDRLKEWFVPTRNDSLFVLSNTKPKVREVEHA